MLGAYFSPLAPAALLLLSAFILPIVMPRLRQRQVYPKLREFGASGLVGLALLTLLGIRVIYGADPSGEEPEWLSAWNFTADGSGAELVVRADGLSLSFLLVALFLLLAVTLLHSEQPLTESGEVNWSQLSVWLVMGASICLLFTSANGLTMIYAVMIFDVIIAFDWLRRGHVNLGVARLFLGIFTASGLIMYDLAPLINPAPGFLLGLALWLRLGLFLYLELITYRNEHQEKQLVYLGLSLAVAIYLTFRVVGQPLPRLIFWLAVITMLLSGLQAWLVGASPSHSKTDIRDRRIQLLGWLILTESLLILLARPLDIDIGMPFGVGLILSLAALWVTPVLGRPRLSERAWSWPYFPAAFATYTLLGLPLSLGWLARVPIYESLFRIDNLAIVSIAILSEALALSGLVRYWFTLVGQGTEVNTRRSVVGIVMMVPFLIPGLAPFILSTITQTDLSLTSTEQFSSIWIVMIILIVGAVGLDYFRDQIIDRLNLPVAVLVELLSLKWLFRWGESLLNHAGKAVLRVRVTLEGQHYIGWAILAALVGGLIILLR